MIKIKDSLRVLIAGVGGGSHGLEILKALRLSKIPYYICAADMSKLSIGLFKADKSYVIPPATSSKYLSAVLDICKKEKIQIIFHGSEPDLKVLSENRSVFEKKGIFLPFNSQKVINLCLNKKQIFNFLKKMNITIPITEPVENIRDIDRIDFFPVIVKPYINSGGSHNVFIAQDREELTFFSRYILKYKGKPLIQEYVGTPEEEYTVGVLSDRKGRIISCVAIRRFILSSLSNRHKVSSLRKKNKILVISSGISQGEVVNNEELLEQCKKIALVLNSKGPLNIQCRFVDNKVYPFEINPRFSGTTYIRALAGVNEPDLLVRKYLLKEDISKNITAKNGVILRGLEEISIPYRMHECSFY